MDTNENAVKKGQEKAITARAEDFSQWYLDVIAAADLAENAPIRGCMTIKPNGYALWENMQAALDGSLKRIGVKNAYFPLFIPESYLKKEAEHVEGFSPELAVVTHGGGKKLEEPLVVRPTSETIMYEAFSRWIQSYRDLPLLINQWANIVRWEMRPRLFIRTSEFLWQEGHTAHKTQDEARDYALMILKDIYKPFVEEYLATPVLAGIKSQREKFAGALNTYCIESLMQDGKSVQMGTTHDLSDHFAKAFDITYTDDREKKQYVFQTSWGVSTRLIGGLIMVHSDDKGLILPPKIAPIQFVITTVTKDGNDGVIAKARELLAALGKEFRGELDDRLELRPGEKFYFWEKRGVPVRLELGPKDLAKNECVVVRRDTGAKETVSLDGLPEKIGALLGEIQQNLFETARKHRDEMSTLADNYGQFTAAVEKGGYVYAHWCEDIECEAKIKEQTKATTRCLPLDAQAEPGEHKCILCGKISPSNKRWVFAKSY
ncbi:MAG: proline--tRNA ligase [Candidatus Saccharibacteria bacterium]